MTTTIQKNSQTDAFTTATIAGKQVEVATPAAVKASASKIMIKYARALKNR